MRRISSRQNPIVQAFREAARNPHPDGLVVLVDGAHLVREADRAGCVLGPVAVLESLDEAESEAGVLARSLETRGVEVYAVGDRVMAAMSPARTPSGIVALAKRPGRSTAATIGEHPRALVVAPVDVQDPGNVGAIVRAAEALGSTGTVVCGMSANPFGWKALRGSMGSALRLPIASGITARQLLEAAPRFGLRTVATVPAGGKAPEVVNWNDRLVLFVGGEGPGLSADVIARCDERVTIPMQPPVESLNVAVATALLLYEARRQRT